MSAISSAPKKSNQLRNRLKNGVVTQPEDWARVFKERREQLRTEVEWTVSMSTTHGLVDGLVKNISLGGALVQSGSNKSRMTS